MTDKLKILREKRGAAVAAMRALTDKATTEKRDLTGEEVAQHDALFKEQDGLRALITAEERQVEIDRELAAGDAERAGAGGESGGGSPDSAEREARAAFGKFLRGGFQGLSANEKRALQADADSTGGFIIPPPAVVNQIIKNIDDQTFIAALATKQVIGTAQSIGAPTLESDAADSDWTAELLTGNEDTSIAFGKREMVPHPVAKRVKISNKLLRLRPDAESFVLGRLAYKFGITVEKGFLTGTGAQQPLGLFTASNDGVPTTRDVSTGNTATAITFDGLIEAKFSLKSAYWPAARWLFHRDAVKQITKLKDGDGQYLWRQSVRDGEPDMLLGRPLMISEYVPNTFTTGLYVGMFADFSHYWMAIALAMQWQRLTELYAETNQVGFIGRMEIDGQPTLPEAFARVKLG